MRHRVFLSVSLPLAALVLAAGCAEILGLEPPTTDTGGAGGTSTTGTTGGTGATGGGGGGTGGSAGCKVDGDCPVANLAPCTKPVCSNGTCGSAPATDGEQVPCYDGPPATENVGVCHAGKQTCIGGTPGPCNGETLPDQEDCGTVQDESCNGATDDCPGNILDVVALPGTGMNDVRAIAADPDGSLYIVGSYSAGGPLAGCNLAGQLPGALSAYVAKLTPSLACVWASILTDGTSSLQLSDVTVASNTVWAIGTASAPLTVFDAMGGIHEPFTSSTKDAIVVAFNQDTGAYTHAYLIGGTGDDEGVAITSSPQSSVFALVQGATGQATSVEGDMIPYTAPGGDGADIVVTAIDAQSAKLYWTRAFGSLNADAPHGIAVRDDRVLVGGSIGLGDAGFVFPDCLQQSVGSPRAFVFDIDVNGAASPPQVCQSWAGAAGAQVTGLSSSGNLVVSAGFSTGVTDLGCGMPGGGSDPIVNGWFRVTDPMSGCTGSALLTGADLVYGVHAEILGQDVLFGGNYGGMLYGSSSQGSDVFLARYPNGMGDPVWHLELGSPGNDVLGDFVVSPLDGSIIAVGMCSGTAFAGKVDCDVGDGFIIRVSP